MVKFIQNNDGCIIQGDTLEEIQAFWKKFNEDFPNHCYKFNDYSEASDGTQIATYIKSYHKQNG